MEWGETSATANDYFEDDSVAATGWKTTGPHSKLTALVEFTVSSAGLKTTGPQPSPLLEFTVGTTSSATAAVPINPPSRQDDFNKCRKLLR